MVETPRWNYLSCLFLLEILDRFAQGRVSGANQRRCGRPSVSGLPDDCQPTSGPPQAASSTYWRSLRWPGVGVSWKRTGQTIVYYIALVEPRLVIIMWARMGCICMTALDLVLTLKLSGFLLRGLALVSVLKQVRDRVVSYPSSSSSPRCIFKTTCISVLRMAMGCDLDSKKKTKNIRCEIYSPQAGNTRPRAFLVHTKSAQKKFINTTTWTTSDTT